MSVATKLWRLRFAALGVAAGLAACELAIRALSTPAPPWWDTVDISADGTDSVAHTLKWYHEGIATSHFSAATARLTGNRFLPNAPVGVITGDSYVQAIQIDDAETMGATVERLSRAHGTPLNVRQFGWSQASPATYVARGPDMLRRWNPAWVAVVLNAQDLVAKALLDAPRARIAKDTSLDIVGPLIEPSTLTGWHIIARDVSAAVAQYSVLLWESAQRFSLIKHAVPRASRSQGAPRAASTPSDTGPPTEVISAATVRSLSRTFGNRLLVVYVATVTATDAPVDREETALLAACRAQDVRCASTRDAMLQLRDERSRLARGFINTAPGGRQHPNALGHAIIGNVIWGLVNDQMADATPTGARTRMQSR